MRIAVLLLPCLFLCACASYAPKPVDVAKLAQPAMTALPGGDLLPVALAQNPAVAAARAAYEATRHDRAAQKRLPPMTLTLIQEYSRQANAHLPWLYTGQLDVPLDTGGRRTGRITSADIAVSKAAYALGDALWTARQDLRQAQSDLDFASRTVALDQQLVETRTAYRDSVDKQVAGGEDSRASADQARLDLSAQQQALALARSSQHQAEIALARATDATPGAAQAWRGSSPASPAITDGQIDDLSAKALYARPDIHAAVADYDSAENDLRVAIAGQYPDIHIAPGYTWERGVVKLPLNWVLTLPPTDLNHTNIAAAMARRAEAGKALEDKVKAAQTEIAQAGETWRTDAAVATRATGDDAPLADAMATRAERSEEAGEASRGDSLLARVAALDAEAAALATQQTVANDRLKLEDALRQPFSAGDADTLGAVAQSDLSSDPHK